MPSEFFKGLFLFTKPRNSTNVLITLTTSFFLGGWFGMADDHQFPIHLLDPLSGQSRSYNSTLRITWAPQRLLGNLGVAQEVRKT